uniref:Dihydrolipoamide acetyltransferase component of pyruvate dehydrogenase complex n=1 Tax=Compsopogon caeruleus TaxID=31354 RepID=A0A7S1XFC9_9RHOD
MVVESDKADMDVESFETGFLADILVQEGEEAPVGSTVALLADTKEDIQAVKDCGLECIVSGSGSRHDGTTAVSPRVAEEAVDSTSSTPASDGAKPGSQQKPDYSEIFMPALSSTMTEGKVVDWLVSEGDKITAGQMVMVVESDKADMEVESFEDGVVAYIASPVGSSGAVGSTVAYLAKTEAEVAKVREYALSLGSPSSGTAPPPSAPVEEITIPTPKASPPAPAPSTGSVINEGRIRASPRARKVAEELGVDLRFVRGTGSEGAIHEEDVRASAAGATSISSTTPAKIFATPDAKKIAKKENIALEKIIGTGNFGRITANDVLKAAGKFQEPSRAPSSPPVAPASAAPRSALPEAAVPMNQMQKAVVKNMNASLGVPVFRVSYSIKTTALDELYGKIKPKGVTVSALLAKAVAITLQQHPIMNAKYENESILYSKSINIGMAVALADGGLITPVLQNANETDIYSLSRSWKDLVKRASEKKLKPDEYSTGNFFISNLGMFGVDSFDAILPPGAGSILAVSSSKPVVGLGKNGMIAVEKEMNVNITCDHRHIYGAQAAEFLRDLAKLIEENVESLLM